MKKGPSMKAPHKIIELSFNFWYHYIKYEYNDISTIDKRTWNKSNAIEKYRIIMGTFSPEFEKCVPSSKLEKYRKEKESMLRSISALHQKLLESRVISNKAIKSL